MHSDYFFQNLLCVAYFLNSPGASSFLCFTGFSFLFQNNLRPHADPVIHSSVTLTVSLQSTSPCIWCNIGILFNYFYFKNLYLHVFLCSLSIKLQLPKTKFYLFHFFLHPVWHLVSAKYVSKVLILLNTQSCVRGISHDRGPLKFF